MLCNYIFFNCSQLLRDLCTFSTDIAPKTIRKFVSLQEYLTQDLKLIDIRLKGTVDLVRDLHIKNDKNLSFPSFSLISLQFSSPSRTANKTKIVFYYPLRKVCYKGKPPSSHFLLSPYCNLLVKDSMQRLQNYGFRNRKSNL